MRRQQADQRGAGFARKALLALGSACAIGALACAGLATAAPRPSGSVTEAVPTAEEAAAQDALQGDQVQAAADTGSGAYTRSDMPRPSGSADEWLDAGASGETAASGDAAGTAVYSRSDMPRPSGSASEWLDVPAATGASAAAAGSASDVALTRTDMPRPSGSASEWLDASGLASADTAAEEAPAQGTTNLPTVAPAAGTQEAEPEVVLEGAWTPEADCASCHADEVASFGDEAAYAFDHATMTCIDCHTDTEALAQVHEGATSTGAKLAMLSTTAVPDELCLACHDQQTIADATADNTMLTDLNGTVVNPHELPEVADHDGITCVSCHSIHGETTDMERTVDRVCASCHHAEVYECYTCHS